MPENVIYLRCFYCGQRQATHWKDPSSDNLATVACSRCTHGADGWTPLDLTIPVLPTLEELMVEVVREAESYSAAHVDQRPADFVNLRRSIRALQAHPDYRAGGPDA